jgi:predicted nucleic acid-binding protein
VLFTVLLDANVIHSLPVCAAILDLREYDLFAVKWSDMIFDEVKKSLLQRGKPFEKIEARLQKMDAAFPDASVTGFQHLISDMHLPDSKDRHVLAAAIACRAEQIVTNNIKDFPKNELQKYNIEAVTADTFLLNALDLYPEITIFTTRLRATKLTKPAIGVTGILKAIRESGAPLFSAALAESMETMRGKIS